VIQWLKRFPGIYNNEPHSGFTVCDTQAGSVRQEGGDTRTKEKKIIEISKETVKLLLQTEVKIKSRGN